MGERDHARILIYSHDTFGLDRLRRCLAVANALVGHFKGLFVLILSGAQVPTGLGLRARVDFVKIPSVIKLYDGQYTSMEEHIDLRDTLEIRRTIIRNTAASFDPDMMIVDDEPFGLTAEIRDTIELLRERGCNITLALPDLIDTRDSGTGRWSDPEISDAVEALYDQIWVYGSNTFATPLDDLGAPQELRARLTYTGYLRRNIPRGLATLDLPFTNPYILATADDSDEGSEQIDWVLTAYENDPTLPHPALLVLGPLVPAAKRKIIRGRAARLDNVAITDFEEGSAALMPGAVGVVTTASYDALCQMLSFDKRVIYISKGEADSVQVARAERAGELNLAQVLTEAEARDPYILSKALHALATRPLPSQASTPDMLDGLDVICARVETFLKQRHRRRLQAVDPNHAFS